MWVSISDCLHLNFDPYLPSIPELAIHLYFVFSLFTKWYFFRTSSGLIIVFPNFLFSGKLPISYFLPMIVLPLFLTFDSMSLEKFPIFWKTFCCRWGEIADKVLLKWGSSRLGRNTGVAADIKGKFYPKYERKILSASEYFKHFGRFRVFGASLIFP